MRSRGAFERQSNATPIWREYGQPLSPSGVRSRQSNIPEWLTQSVLIDQRYARVCGTAPFFACLAHAHYEVELQRRLDDVERRRMTHGHELRRESTRGRGGSV